MLRAIVFLTALFAAHWAEADIFGYLAREDASFSWREIGETSPGVIEFEITSQTWQGIVWKHRMFLVAPEEVAPSTSALLWITGSGKGTREIEDARQVARDSGCPVFILMDVPNQPLFGGLYEDDIIAYTFLQTLKTGDPSWILLFPMTRSAVRAMDVAQEHYRRQGVTITNFVVTGASKRGWTTWFTACVDSRVGLIVPMVYDNLNLEAQMPNQLAAWGRYSEEISEYSGRGLPQLLRTEKGRILARLVDPYTYRDRIEIPRIVLCATNDRYWPLDSAKFYHGDFKTPSRLLYVPNNGHGIRDRARMRHAFTAGLNHCAGKTPLPGLSWNFERMGSGARLTLTPEGRVVERKLWQAHGSSLDFRDAQWYAVPWGNGGESAEAYPRGPGFHAVYAEVIFQAGDVRLSLCTSVHIWRTDAD